MTANPLEQPPVGRCPPPVGPRWLHVVGAALVAALLLFSGPLRCTAPVTLPPHEVPEAGLATGTTTWSRSTEGPEG